MQLIFSKLSKPLRFFAAGSLLILLILISVFSVIYLIQKKPVLAFYNVPQKVKNQIISVSEKVTDNSFKILELNSSIPLSLQKKSLKKADLVFVRSDSDTKEFFTSSKAKIFKPLEKKLLSGTASTIQKTVPASEKNKNQIFYIPFLYDMYQIDVNYEYFKKTGFPFLNTWDDLVSIAKKEADFVNTPVVFPVKDDREFLNIFGQFIEAFFGFEEYESFLSSLYNAFKKDIKTAEFEKKSNMQKTTFNQTISFIEKFVDSPVFNKIAVTFGEMQNKGILADDVTNFSKEDSLFFAENKLCGFYLTSLSNHRLIPRNSLNDYKSIYFPNIGKYQERKFCADEYAVAKIKSNKSSKQIIEAISSTYQTVLSTQTGLAPVQKNCKTPDQQSDDVRYYLAASTGPVLPLSSCMPSPQAQKLVSHLIKRNLFQAEK